MARLFNPTAGPVYLDDGVMVGGGEHTDHNLTATVRSHLDAGRLVQIKVETTEPATKDVKEKRG